MASELQAWDIAANGLDLQRAQERNNPDLAQDSACFDAFACISKAEFSARSGNTDQSGHWIHTAIQTLHDAPSDQNIDFDRWMALAERALPLAPQTLPSLLMACERQLARTEVPPPSQAIQTHRKVRIVRLQAQACAHAGQLEAALQLAPQGHFGLTDDEVDPFTAITLGWLLEAKRMDEAAALALESVIHARPVSAVAAYQLALSRFGTDPERDITWALILAESCLDEDMRQLLTQADLNLPSPAHGCAFLCAAQDC